MWLEMTSAMIKIKFEYIYMEFWDFRFFGDFFFFLLLFWVMRFVEVWLLRQAGVILVKKNCKIAIRFENPLHLIKKNMSEMTNIKIFAISPTTGLQGNFIPLT